MHHNTAEEYIGVDVGSVRVGLARGSSAARLAEPLETVAAADAVKQLSKIASHHNASGIVVGLPRNLNAQDTDQTEFVRNWVDRAQATIKLPFYWQDEALTSREAAGKAQTLKHKTQNPGEDAVAAAMILQDFLDTPEAQRVRC